MKWNVLLDLVGLEPVFTTGFLASYGGRLANLRLQLSRWTKSGRLIQLRRGVYMLAEPYRKTQPDPFFVANVLQKASYVSLQSALAYYGMIPEYVPMVMSVTTGRPGEINTVLGRFRFRHVKTSWFRGYRQVELGPRQSAFIAVPEKALLDLAYLTPGGDSRSYWDELRLQNIQNLDMDKMHTWIHEHGGGKLLKAMRCIETLIADDEGYEL